MSIHEECGVFGVMSTKRENVASIAYCGLYALQHRGQESCGIVVKFRPIFGKTGLRGNCRRGGKGNTYR